MTDFIIKTNKDPQYCSTSYTYRGPILQTLLQLNIIYPSACCCKRIWNGIWTINEYWHAQSQRSYLEMNNFYPIPWSKAECTCRSPYPIQLSVNISLWNAFPFWTSTAFPNALRIPFRASILPKCACQSRHKLCRSVLYSLRVWTPHQCTLTCHHHNSRYIKLYPTSHITSDGYSGSWQNTGDWSKCYILGVS